MSPVAIDRPTVRSKGADRDLQLCLWSSVSSSLKTIILHHQLNCRHIANPVLSLSVCLCFWPQRKPIFCPVSSGKTHKSCHFLASTGVRLQTALLPQCIACKGEPVAKAVRRSYHAARASPHRPPKNIKRAAAANREPSKFFVREQTYCELCKQSDLVIYTCMRSVAGGQQTSSTNSLNNVRKARAD